jgi:uncharacterized protein (DUF2267 family)
MTPSDLYDTLAKDGLDDRAVAKHALRSTLIAFAERLTDDETASLAAALPPELSAIVRSTSYDGEIDAAELFERVRRREKVGAGVARERAQIVLRALAEHLPEDVLTRLRRHLPGDIGALLARREVDRGVAEHAVRAGEGHSLARGRPGSRRPLSEARPTRTHAESVAAENPHGDTKLSSARGLTQERLGETLATGHGVATRPIADADDLD